MSKWKSRKFWMAIGMMVVTLAVGFGYELKPEIVVMLTAAEGGLYVIIEGIIDAVSKKG